MSDDFKELAESMVNSMLTGGEIAGKTNNALKAEVERLQAEVERLKKVISLAEEPCRAWYKQGYGYEPYEAVKSILAVKS